MPRHTRSAGTPSDRAQTERLMNMVVDPLWYRARHRDVAASGMDPLRHFIEAGLRERRDPNRWFDGAWYTRQYADVAASGAHPLLHYLSEGAAKGRDPHPRFDAGWYVEQHAGATGNPLLFHLRVGAARGYLTERPVAIENYLPSTLAPFTAPEAIPVDVVVPVYRGFDVTRSCLDSLLADPDRPNGRIIVIDDRSPEPELVALLRTLERSGAVTVLRNRRNLGFVASVNRGMEHAGTHDVVLLNNDTEVPHGWLRRLQAQAYAAENIASVSPLSNNASICSYLDYAGAPLPRGMTLAGIDAACRTVNAGRFAPAPTTVGFCMYIRRAALDQVGLFDVQTFGKGYGEENDFCLRASDLGWRHRIACDTFVWHEGGASFGADADAGIARAYGILTERYPDYPLKVANHVHDDVTAPFRFALTMAMFRASGLPTVLQLSHDLDGGVRRHVRDMVDADGGGTNYMVLEPAARGLALTLPALAGHPRLVLAAERWRDVAAVARSGGVTRVHIQHLMGLDLDARALIHDLGADFDVTVHDYFALCPQVTLLPWSAGPYCGEPGPAGCDACIANRPSHGAIDILSWRLRWRWQFIEADRVLAPSRDALDRLRRYGVGERAVLAPHEPARPGSRKIAARPRPGKRLRVAVLGVLANHKGAHVVASVALAADPRALEIQLIGYTEAVFPDAARQRMTVHGPYGEGELPALLAKYRPDVIWFPAAWPETYSFTLSAALDAGLPIAASQIGAFPERLSGRDLTWLIPPTADPAPWLALFDTIADALRRRRTVTTSANFIARRAAAGDAGKKMAANRRPAARIRGSSKGFVDIRRDRVTAVLAIPETFDNGTFTPCAHIRLLRPLDHPAAGRGLAVTVADAAAACRYQADVIITQRHAVPSVEAAENLAAHARRTGAALIYDLDDDLLGIPADHPEAAELTAKAGIVERMLRLADLVRTSTDALGSKVGPMARQVLITGNGLDERIWLQNQRLRQGRNGTDGYHPVRILCMGTATHDSDFAVILPAITEIHRQFGDQVRFDLIGFVGRLAVPPWIHVLAPTPHAARSYPGFVNWVTSAGAWDIGLAPLADSPFNAAKSAIKTLDYAALGLATLASDAAAYRGSVADGSGGRLVANTDVAWYEALSHLIRDAATRRALAAGGGQSLREIGTLMSQAQAWRAAWPRLKIGKRARRT